MNTRHGHGENGAHNGVVRVIDANTDFIYQQKFPKAVRDFLLYEMAGPADMHQLYAFYEQLGEHEFLRQLAILRQQEAWKLYGPSYPILKPEMKTPTRRRRR